VVLGCNGYEVIDMGVMVPADKILETAEKENVDIIGLSGLITPSLDEMVHVAKEMKRRNMKQPLLIGGATTSRTHTAVKIAPEYQEGVVHVLDASRSVTVAGNLLNKEQKPGFLNNVGAEYDKIRTDFANKRTVKEYIPYADAQQKGVQIDWDNYTPPVPAFTGTKVFADHDLNEIRQYIDWGPFFIAWEMKGKFPAILTDPHAGAEATKLYNDANALLDTIIKEQWLNAQGVIGFWQTSRPAPDTIVVHDNNGNELKRLEHLRQQIKKAENQPEFSLADFISPVQGDHIGAFAVSIHGIEPHLQRFIAAHDDYNKIMLQALADRLAEAFAETLHLKVRKEHWGYAKDEDLSSDELVKETYRGIRPAPGYPACPDHTEKYKLFDLLNATENAGIQLTESLAMYPAASVCGWYFSHPDSTYFGIGHIEPDQFEDYTKRKGLSADEMRKWLSPILDA
jgi:5-methyltetrahydrofolate--homocysteine methyltransferase